MRLEYLSALAASGASSIYWLGAAYLMSAADYGRAAQLQSLLSIMVALASLRTYDFFYFQRRHRVLSGLAAYRLALRVEMTMGSAAIMMLAVVGWIWTGQVSDPWGLRPWIGERSWLVMALLPMLFTPLLQGSAQAYLRDGDGVAVIVVSDALSAVAFVAAVSLLWHAGPTAPTAVAAWIVAAAIRPVSLTLGALSHAHRTRDGISKTAPAFSSSDGYYLLNGQFLNIAKNGGPSIELLTVSLFASPATVGVFRLTRSFVNMTTPIFNVMYQRFIRIVRDLHESTEQNRAMEVFDGSLSRVWFAVAPVILLAFWVFSLFHPDRAYNGQLLGVGLLLAANFPAVLQQGLFAVASVDGHYRLLTIAFGAGLLLTFLLSWISQPLAIPIIAIILFMANLVRVSILRVARRRGHL